MSPTSPASLIELWYSRLVQGGLDAVWARTESFRASSSCPKIDTSPFKISLGSHSLLCEVL